MSTPHFTDAELRCRCGCGLLPPPAFQTELEALRLEYGAPMKLSSCYRCPDHNEEVSSTGRDGPHTLGAVDVLVYGQHAWKLLGVAMRYGWQGIGVSQKGPRASRFLHLDRLTEGTRPWVWSY